MHGAFGEIESPTHPSMDSAGNLQSMPQPHWGPLMVNVGTERHLSGQRLAWPFECRWKGQRASGVTGRGLLETGKCIQPSTGMMHDACYGIVGDIITYPAEMDQLITLDLPR